MNIANCRLMGLALGPQMPPLDVKSVMNNECIALLKTYSLLCLGSPACALDTGLLAQGAE